jgi:hypothetical protein
MDKYANVRRFVHANECVKYGAIHTHYVQGCDGYVFMHGSYQECERYVLRMFPVANATIVA